MIKEWRQNIRKHLEDPDDENAHHNPFANLFRQRVFDDPAEEEAESGDDDRNDDCGPEHEAFAEYSFVHSQLS